MQQFALQNTAAISHQDLGAYIRSIVAEAPELRATVHLVRGEEEGTVLTYAALDRIGRSLGAFFQARQAQGERAIMLFDGGVEPIAAFLGCLYSRVVAVPLPAPLSGRVNRYLPRVEKVVKDAGVKFVLTTTSIMQQLREMASKIPAFQDVEWIAMDRLADMADEWEEEVIQESDLAYLQYTSGSTSDPKGVMISHGNLLRICEYDSALLNFSRREGCAVCWMPYYHDYGLIEGLLVPLYNGLTVYIMSPLEFVAHPVRWLNAINRYRATNSSGPNFAFELCVRKTTPEQRAALDLSCWHTVSCAAEPISSGTVERFLTTFAPCGFRADAFYASWGLAEATLLVTGGPGATFHRLSGAELEKDRIAYSNGGPTRTMVGCGRVLKGDLHVDVQIVDPETHKQSEAGKVGEVWVTGELVAQGYWNRPAETASIFRAQINGGNGDYFLRTGDLGFMADGELVFTGRRKDLIIVEGRNHYPQDIEKTAEAAHPALRPGCSIAFSLELDGEVQVILVAELNKEYHITGSSSEVAEPEYCVSQKDIEKTVRRHVAEDHQIRIHEVVLVAPSTIPKTSSGKLQRNACRQRFLAGSLTPAQ
jgi:acyl-CoA synthetase (AMP-forming)/AMP-acid ligase II